MTNNQNQQNPSAANATQGKTDLNKDQNKTSSSSNDTTKNTALKNDSTSQRTSADAKPANVNAPMADKKTA